MRKIHLFIHAICLVAITCLVLERRTAEDAKSTSIKGELAVAPKPSPVATKAAVNASPSRRSRPEPTLDPVEQILREYGEEAGSMEWFEDWATNQQKHQHLDYFLRGVPAEMAARRNTIWLELQNMGLTEKFTSHDLDEDLVMDDEELRALPSTVPSTDLQFLAKMLALRQEYQEIEKEMDRLYPAIPSNIGWCESLSDTELKPISEHLIPLVQAFQKRGQLTGDQGASWEILVEQVKRDFAALPPSKPRYDQLWEGQPGGSRADLADAWIQAMRNEMQSAAAKKP